MWMTHSVLLDLQFMILRVVVLLKLVPVACCDDEKCQSIYAAHCAKCRSSKHSSLRLRPLIASVHELNPHSDASAYCVILSNFIAYELIDDKLKQLKTSFNAKRNRSRRIRPR
uniref:Secreted protein n=1 Tax=Glossina palpalis gambiensis TaxID=67801 RepID=A0A1B0ANJ2_9MUSC